VLLPASQYVQARRWVKYPATLLFALSLVWLATSLFNLDWAHAQAISETGVGIARLLMDFIIVPLGGAVVGVFLLSVKAWAIPVAALLPLEPLIVSSLSKLERISGKFTIFHDTQDASSLGAAVMDIFLLIALWSAYALMLGYLYKAWRIVRSAAPRRAGASAAAATAGSRTAAGARPEEGETCMLLPEVGQSEDFEAV
jgi:hypothetical protein